jgi:hypothetical protein
MEVGLIEHRQNAAVQRNAAGALLHCTNILHSHCRAAAHAAPAMLHCAHMLHLHGVVAHITHFSPYRIFLAIGALFAVSPLAINCNGF